MQAEAQAFACAFTFKFESGQQSFPQFAGVILRMGWFNRGSNPQSTQNRSIGWNGRNPKHRFKAARPARKRSPKPAQRKSRERFSRRRTAVSCLGLILRGTKQKQK
jgi:hypothetical protein